MKRAIEKILTGSSKAKWDTVAALAAQAGRNVPLKDLPFRTAANSINNFAINTLINDDHRKRYIRSEIKSTWHDIKFEDKDIPSLIEGHKPEMFGKALERNLGSSTRFRKYCSCVRSVLANEEIYGKLYEKTHPHHFLVSMTRRPDFKYLAEISPALDRFEKSINLFESSEYQHGSAYYAEMERLLIFIGTLQLVFHIFEQKFLR